MGFGGKFSKKPYLEQFERIKRWHKILNEIRVSNASEDRTDYQVDCIFAFFINCYHLRDWLEHSKVTSPSILNDFIENHKEMQICRDICNGAKHLSLTSRSIGKDVKCDCGFHGVFLHREYDPFQEVLKHDNPVRNITYNIFVEYEKFNVFEVADKCVSLWEDFLKENNLL
jgi:hypothetical protein